MELYKEILSQLILEKGGEEYQVLHLPEAQSMVEMACYKALQEIKAVLVDNSLDDADCFQRIERIICIFESLGSDVGSRHDFG